MAVCPTLGLLVTSNTSDNTLSVFALARSISAGAGAGSSLAIVCTLGGRLLAFPHAVQVP